MERPTRRIRSQVVLLFWFCVVAFHAAGQTPSHLDIARPGPKAADYSQEPKAFVVVGVVGDTDFSPDCRGNSVLRAPDGKEVGREPCVGLTLLAVRPTLVFGTKPRDRFVFILFLGAIDPAGVPVVHNGDIVAVTARTERDPDMWSCGRLAPCDAKPQSIERAIEVFRRTN